MSAHLQPCENVQGRERSGDPILESPETSNIVGRLARTLYSTAIAAHSSPAGRDLFDRMEHPRAEDLVVVKDAFYGNADDLDRRHKAVGYLLTVRREWWSTDEQWEAQKAEDEFLTEEDRIVEAAAWYIQYGPNADDICRWVNCDVIAVEVHA